MKSEVGQGGVLAVHAHPDDETLATGALLATWAATGEPVTVVTCTRGERGEVIDTASQPTGLGHLEGDRAALASHREGELADALAALGVADHVFLDGAARGTGPGDDGHDRFACHARRYEDSGMAWVAPGVASTAVGGAPQGSFVDVPVDAAAWALAAVIRARRPRVVVTYEPGGGYGHPDHVRAHDVTARAVELAASGDWSGPEAGDLSGGPRDEPWQVAELWAPVVPEALLRSARRELGASGGIRGDSPVGGDPTAAPAFQRLVLPDPDEAELPTVATWWPDAAIAAGARRDLVVIDVRPVLDPVLAALRAHATQVQAVARTPPGTTGPGTGPLPGDRAGEIIGSYALSNDVLAPILAGEAYAVIPLGAASGAPGTVGA